MTTDHQIDRVMMTVVQSQDVDSAINALTSAGFFVTLMSSSGAFLGRKSVTLLVGLPASRIETAVNLLNESCRRRVEYVATSLEGSAYQLPLSTPVTVGGATIFTLNIVRWEAIP